MFASFVNDEFVLDTLGAYRLRAGTIYFLQGSGFDSSRAISRMSSPFISSLYFLSLYTVYIQIKQKCPKNIQTKTVQFPHGTSDLNDHKK